MAKLFKATYFALVTTLFAYSLGASLFPHLASTFFEIYNVVKIINNQLSSLPALLLTEAHRPSYHEVIKISLIFPCFFLPLVCCYSLYHKRQTKLVDDLGNFPTTTTITPTCISPTTDVSVAVMNNNLTSITSALTSILNTLATTTLPPPAPTPSTITIPSAIDTSNIVTTPSGTHLSQLEQISKLLTNNLNQALNTLVRLDCYIKAAKDIPTVNASRDSNSTTDTKLAATMNHVTIANPPKTFTISLPSQPNLANPNPLDDVLPFSTAERLELSEEDLYNLLMKRRAAVRHTKVSAKLLTAEEQELAMTDLCRLARLWKTKRNPTYKFRSFDHESLGTLTEEEAQLPRNNVQEIINARKHALYVARARAAGKLL
ncbi:putative transmembrane protein, partial [Gregarina niphandrodes]